MLTLFAIPKPFKGHIAVIQRNAIESWARLGHGVRVVLFGGEDGTATVARDLGLEHVADVQRNEFGTPLLSELFETGRRLATPDDTLCYVNSDIVLLDDFLPAVARVRARMRRFLMVGECWNLDLPTPVPFADPSWQAELRRRVVADGEHRGSWFIDYFVFNHDLYPAPPPFAVGRAGFDNWLVWRARILGVPVVDASQAVMAVHQQHDYAHVAGGREWAYRGPEVERNVQLGGGSRHLYHIGDATHVLTSERLRRQKLWTRFLKATWSIRHRVWLHGEALRRLRGLGVDPPR